MSRKLDSSAARRDVRSNAAAKARLHSDPIWAVDLVSYHHLDTESLAEVEHALRVGEAGARGLDADSGGAAV
jgi:hypothetical protein